MQAAKSELSIRRHAGPYETPPKAPEKPTVNCYEMIIEPSTGDDRYICKGCMLYYIEVTCKYSDKPGG